MAEVILNNDNFKAEVLDAKGLVLVDFWATWCGPCKMLAPTVSEIADEYEGKVKVCKLDVDQAMDIAMSYGVASIPTQNLYKDGENVKKSIGVVSTAEIEAMWSQNIADTKEGRAYDEDRAYCDVCAGSGKNKRFFREIFCSNVQCNETL